MDLELVGRHVILFDDDAMAAFVNSRDALVEWNSLQIDRYDVRHLLSAPIPPRRPTNSHCSPNAADSLLELELDLERYLDLPDSSDNPEEAEGPGDTGGYRAVPFSYGNAGDSADQKNSDGGLEYSGFQPSFPVPESLLQRLPPTEKLHQIIARTAIFVNQHGGQSEIVLRVKQGDNPTFGFLMPDHHLHAYFRFLVDNPELLQSNVEEKTQFNDKTVEIASELVFGGALTLLGSVYGYEEDEDRAEVSEDAKCSASEKTDDAPIHQDSHSSEKIISTLSDAEKDKVQVMSKLPALSSREAPCLKKNPSIAVSKSGSTSGKKKADDPASYLASLKKSKEPLVVEPPSDVKKLIDRIVEFTLKNGKLFEASMFEQDSKQFRFSFLLPSDQYHPYYLQVLQRAQESKVGPKNPRGIDDSTAGRGPDRRGLYQDRGITSSGSVSDVPYELDRKEKFKMVIRNLKKDVHDLPSKTTQEESGITMDVAAAILKAATRGIKNPNLGILSTASANSNSSASPDNYNRNGGHRASDTVASTIAKTATESVSSEAHLTKEQKLKAERLKRAKMFVARFKDGSVPSANELLCSSSMEPVESGVSGKGSKADHVVEDKEVALSGSSILGQNAEVVLVVKAREGSAALTDGGDLNGSTIFERKYSNDDNMDRILKRKYRSRSERNDENNEENEKEETDGHDSHSKRIYESSLESDDGGLSNAVDGDHKLSRKKHCSSHERLWDEDHRKEKSRKHRKKRQSHCHSGKDECDNSGTEASHSHSHSKHKKRYSRRSSREDEDEHHVSAKYRKLRSHRHSDEEDYSDSGTDTSSGKHTNNKHSSHHSSCEDDDEDHDKYHKHKHSKKKHRSRHSSHRSRESRKRRKSDSSRDEEPRLVSKHDSSSDDARVHEPDEERKGSHPEKEDLEEGEISSQVSGQHLGGLISNETSMENITAHSSSPSQISQPADVPDDLRAKIRAMLMATR